MDMHYQIKKYNDLCLRKLSKNLTHKNITNSFINDLFDTLYNVEGIGLSAPEIGINKNIFIIDTAHGLDEFFGIKEVFINPIILNYSEDRDILEEDCLTMPNVKSFIERPNKIKIQYRNKNFKKKIEEFENIEARIIQHNYDHLKGILLIDRMTIKDRKRISKK